MASCPSSTPTLKPPKATASELAIVGVFFPIAWLLRHTLFYRWVVVTGGSLAVALLGTLWTLERTGLYKF